MEMQAIQMAIQQVEMVIQDQTTTDNSMENASIVGPRLLAERKECLQAPKNWKQRDARNEVNASNVNNFWHASKLTNILFLNFAAGQLTIGRWRLNSLGQVVQAMHIRESNARPITKLPPLLPNQDF